MIRKPGVFLFQQQCMITLCIVNTQSTNYYLISNWTGI